MKEAWETIESYLYSEPDEFLHLLESLLEGVAGEENDNNYHPSWLELRLIETAVQSVDNSADAKELLNIIRSIRSIRSIHNTR